jgi:hypothetical protein
MGTKGGYAFSILFANLANREGKKMMMYYETTVRIMSHNSFAWVKLHSEEIKQWLQDKDRVILIDPTNTPLWFTRTALYGFLSDDDSVFYRCPVSQRKVNLELISAVRIPGPAVDTSSFNTSYFVYQPVLEQCILDKKNRIFQMMSRPCWQFPTSVARSAIHQGREATNQWSCQDYTNLDVLDLIPLHVGEFLTTLNNNLDFSMDVEETKEDNSIRTHKKRGRGEELESARKR